MNLGQSTGVSLFAPNSSDQVFGNTCPAVASTTTIAISSMITRITGNTTIQTITVPEPNFTGPVYLFNTDASVGATGTSGNIALATTFTRYKLFTFIYDAAASKWYASATS
jgi:hypothetical protein